MPILRLRSGLLAGILAFGVQLAFAGRASPTHYLGSDATRIQDRGISSDRRAVGSRCAASCARDELSRGQDEDDNRLIDETGLAFRENGNNATIHLKNSKSGPSGTSTTKTRSEDVTCRI